MPHHNAQPHNTHTSHHITCAHIHVCTHIHTHSRSQRNTKHNTKHDARTHMAFERAGRANTGLTEPSPRRYSTQGRWPFSAATWRGVAPLRNGRSREAPASSSAFSTCGRRQLDSMSDKRNVSLRSDGRTRTFAPNRV